MNTKRYISLVATIMLSVHIFAQSISSLKHDAEYRNDSWSQNKLGTIYENGEGVEKNMQIAFQWYNKAASNGYKYGYYNLGRHYEYGLSVAKDLNKAFSMYEKAASLYHSFSSLILGKWYLYGTNVAQNYYKAASYLKDAAFGDQKEGKYYYSLCFAQGYGVARDSVKATIWANRAIDDNYPAAYRVLGLMYEEGKTVVRNIEKAQEYYNIGMKAGDIECAIYMGLCHERSGSDKVNIRHALAAFNWASSKGSIKGDANIARLHMNPDYYCYNLSKAEKIYKNLIKGGYSEYEENLLEIYEMTDNKVGEFEILKKWADEGSAIAMNELSYMYVKGEGVTQSLDKALEYINKAISKEPKNLNYLDTKGELYLIVKEEKKAEKIWKSIKKKNPTFYNTPDEGYYPSALNEYFLNKQLAK